MPKKPDHRADYFKAFFGPRVGAEFAKLGWAALRRAIRDPADPLGEKLPTYQRERLHALIRLCELFYPEQDFEPSTMTGSADVVRFYQERCRELRQRVAWLLCLDHEGGLIADVLVQIGGDPLVVPPPEADAPTA